MSGLATPLTSIMVLIQDVTQGLSNLFGMSGDSTALDNAVGAARVDTIHILPYHVYGENKYGLIGREYPMGYDIKPLPKEEAAKFKKIVEDQGLKCVIEG